MSSKTVASYHNTTQHKNPEDLHLNLHCCENLKPCIISSCYQHGFTQTYEMRVTVAPFNAGFID